MKGRAFLDVARELVRGGSEAHWRAAAGRAYYALMSEGRSRLEGWGFRALPRQEIHSFVRLKFLYAADLGLKDVGDKLGRLVQLRNQADYRLTLAGPFHSASSAQDAIKHAENCIRFLDQIEADPQRRRSAIASIRP